MIRITLEKDAWTSWANKRVAAKTVVREFDDPMAAANWFIHDSYFDEGYTRKAVWERLDDPA